jgi:hypothetical protein
MPFSSAQSVYLLRRRHSAKHFSRLCFLLPRARVGASALIDGIGTAALIDGIGPAALTDGVLTEGTTALTDADGAAATNRAAEGSGGDGSRVHATSSTQ